MSMKKWTTGALAAALLTSAPAFAGDDGDRLHGYDRDHYPYSSDARYQWTTEPGQTILFKDPVSFEGEVMTVTDSHRVIVADNDMIIRVPNMALVWNGDTQMFAQDADLGERVVLHLRQEEPYRIMMRDADTLAIGSYDGVFFLPENFVADINLDDLDDDIYRGTAEIDYDDLDDDDYVYEDTADVDLDGDGYISNDEEDRVIIERDRYLYDNDLNGAYDSDVVDVRVDDDVDVIIIEEY